MTSPIILPAPQRCSLVADRVVGAAVVRIESQIGSPAVIAERRDLRFLAGDQIGQSWQRKGTGQQSGGTHDGDRIAGVGRVAGVDEANRAGCRGCLLLA